jgi:hypothetical protein
MDPTVAAVVETLRENRERFIEFSRSLSAEELVRPVPASSWEVRDFIAHLGTLDVPLARFFETIARGEAAPSGSPGDALQDVDAFNDAQVLARRAWPLDQVLAEAAQNRAKLIPALESLSGPQIEQSMHFPGDAKRGPGDVPLKLFLTGWAQHDPIHAADMLRALPERAADAALQAWIENPFVRGYQAVMNR